MSDDRPTDPSTKFGARAAQVTVPVVGDDRPSIAELQKNDARHTVHGVLWDAWPVLLEIAAAAQVLFAMDVDEDSDAAEIELCVTRRRALEAALAKVRP